MTINGPTVLPNFDIVAVAGANKVLVESFPSTTANSSGQIIISFTAGSADQPKVSGIEVLSAAAAASPTITTQPASKTTSVGGTATFSVVVAGTGPFTYQWSKNNTNLAGATGASYTTPATTSADNGNTFKVVVTNSGGSTSSSTATLTVTAAAAPTITTQPVSQTIALGATATFSVVAGGAGPFTYQWSKNNTNILGATGASYTTPVISAANNGSTFKVLVTGSGGSTSSSAATPTVTATVTKPAITTQPTAQTATIGGTALFSVAVSGTGPTATMETQFCAAFNRHEMLNPSTWTTPSAWYLAAPANYYAAFWHAHSVDGLAYGFAYDDVSGQSSTISTGTPEHMAFGIGW